MTAPPLPAALLTVREAQILDLLRKGTPEAHIVEIGVYRRSWSASDVRRVFAVWQGRSSAVPAEPESVSPPALQADCKPWRPAALDNVTPSTAAITAMQAAVLGHLCRGLSNRGIAEVLHISEDTVKTHMKTVIAACGARDRTHAAVRVLTGQVLVSVRSRKKATRGAR